MATYGPVWFLIYKFCCWNACYFAALILWHSFWANVVALAILGVWVFGEGPTLGRLCAEMLCFMVCFSVDQLKKCKEFLARVFICKKVYDGAVVCFEELLKGISSCCYCFCQTVEAICLTKFCKVYVSGFCKGISKYICSPFCKFVCKPFCNVLSTIASCLAGPIKWWIEQITK